MCKFAEAWPDKQIVQRTVAQIPWRSNLALLDKLKSFDLRLWYAQKTTEHGWSKNILSFQIVFFFIILLTSFYTSNNHNKVYQ